MPSSYSEHSWIIAQGVWKIWIEWTWNKLTEIHFIKNMFLKSVSCQLRLQKVVEKELARSNSNIFKSKLRYIPENLIGLFFSHTIFHHLTAVTLKGCIAYTDILSSYGSNKQNHWSTTTQRRYCTSSIHLKWFLVVSWVTSERKIGQNLLITLPNDYMGVKLVLPNTSVTDIAHHKVTFSLFSPISLFSWGFQFPESWYFACWFLFPRKGRLIRIN